MAFYLLWIHDSFREMLKHFCWHGYQRHTRIHKYGSLAAAREWDNNPNKLSNPFEFYVVQNKKGAPHLDNQHTVFGEVFEGFEKAFGRRLESLYKAFLKCHLKAFKDLRKDF